MSKPNYRRLEIWWVKLDPTEGSEASKTRPCLILQNDLGNQYTQKIEEAIALELGIFGR